MLWKITIPRGLLRYFGAAKNAETDLEEESAVRLGSPLVDDAGNMVSRITSYANHTLRDLRVRTFLPEGVRPPKQVFATRNSSRVVQKLDFTYDKTRNAVEAAWFQTEPQVKAKFQETMHGRYGDELFPGFP